LGYMVTDTTLNKLTVTRQHLSFDPQLFPLRLKPTAPPLFRNFVDKQPGCKGPAERTRNDQQPALRARAT
jgi:hypothetical protein